FRHFIDGLISLASFNLACRDHVPTFPQRSPPSLLTTAACGGLRPEPDCRSRRALLHLSYSCAPPFGPAMLVTHGTYRRFGPMPKTVANGVKRTKVGSEAELGGGFGPRCDICQAVTRPPRRQ